MRILVVSHRAYPVTGGLEKHVYAFAHEISVEKEDIVLQNLAFTNEASTEIEINSKFSIKKVHAPFLFKGGYPIPMPWDFIAFWRAIGDFKPELIHTHSRYMISTFIAQVYAITHGIKFVHTEHVSGPIEFKSLIFKFIGWLIDRIIVQVLLPRASKITAVSHSAIEYLKKSFGVNAELIPNFIDEEELESYTHIKNEFDYLNTDPRQKIMFMYRLVESKGFEHFLELIYDTSEDEYLFIMGGGGPGEDLARKYMYKHPNKLRYLGNLPHDKAMRLMQRVDVVVNFSRQEGLPGTLMEAMYYDKKVLASNIKPNIEALEGYDPVVFVELNRENIYKGLKKMDELMPDNTSGSELLKKKKYTKKTASMLYLELYKKLLAQK